MSPVPDSLAWAVDALSVPWEDLEPYGFLPVAILGKMVAKIKGLPQQENHSDCSRLAQHALVLGSESHIKPKLPVPAQPTDSTIQSDSTQESITPKSLCLAPRASPSKGQGIYQAVAARIKAQRVSYRSVYEAKWAILKSGATGGLQGTNYHFQADFLLYLARTGSYSQVLLMATDQS